MSFVPKGSRTETGVAKFVAGACELILEKVGQGEKELGLSGRVDHKNGDGVIRDLGRLLNSFYSSLRPPDRLPRADRIEGSCRLLCSAAASEQAVQRCQVRRDARIFADHASANSSARLPDRGVSRAATVAGEVAREHHGRSRVYPL
jgi:hypothetical protein